MNQTMNTLANEFDISSMSDTEAWLIGVIAVIVALGLIVRLAIFLHGFSRELTMLNMEINRTDGRERQYYIRRRRRLWLSLIPFVRY